MHVTVGMLLHLCYYMFVTMYCTLSPAVTLKNCAFPSAVYLCVLCNWHNTRQLFTWRALYIYSLWWRCSVFYVMYQTNYDVIRKGIETEKHDNATQA